MKRKVLTFLILTLAVLLAVLPLALPVLGANLDPGSSPGRVYGTGRVCAKGEVVTPQGCAQPTQPPAPAPSPTPARICLQGEVAVSPGVCFPAPQPQFCGPGEVLTPTGCAQVQAR